MIILKKKCVNQTILFYRTMEHKGIILSFFHVQNPVKVSLVDDSLACPCIIPVYDELNIQKPVPTLTEEVQPTIPITLKAHDDVILPQQNSPNTENILCESHS